MFRKISFFIFLLFILAQNFRQKITITGNKFEKCGKDNTIKSNTSAISFDKIKDVLI